MSMQDPIADLFTRIRNAIHARKLTVLVPESKFKVSILSLLKREGYIEDYKHTKVDNKPVLEVFIKYSGDKAVISEIKRVSKPSLPIYKDFNSIPTVYGGLGIVIVSTSKGVISDKELRALSKKGTKLGGEIIGTVV